jgi:hypothetical protein
LLVGRLSGPSNNMVGPTDLCAAFVVLYIAVAK